MQTVTVDCLIAKFRTANFRGYFSDRFKDFFPQETVSCHIIALNLS